ncbi:hypothetical protein ACIQNG_35425 [Streptomyces sp. NPDC091377]|uniref:hypothetical protein n=1 Tax=Streptomyces sp. NPDC091377 TaxID=3365995 RepID=UPI0037FB0A4F
MIKSLMARQRHHRLMNAAERVVRDAELSLTSSTDQVTPTQVVWLAFARYRMRIDEAEAADYLAAALVARGHGTCHRPAASA